MSLTTSESAILKADILADPALAQAIASQDWPAIAIAYNASSSPVVSVWRPDVTPSEIASAVTMSDFVALTAVKQNGLLLLTQGTVDATKANVRTAFSSIFGAGTTLTSLTTLAQRTGTRFEVLFSSASGAANVSTKYGQQLTDLDVQKAMI